MNVLDYQAESSQPRSLGVALIVLPIAATAVAFAVAGHNVYEEPFGLFDMGDALVQVGGPVLVFGLWIAWAVVAVRRRRPRLPGLALLLGWAVVTSLIALVFLVAYFHEPWNHQQSSIKKSPRAWRAAR